MDHTSCRLRLAAIADAPAILEIYAQYMDTPITFETEMPSLEEFEGRIRAITAEYPWIVCEDETGKTKPYVLHAEANAITKIARSNNSSSGATMYVTASPCIECAKLIIQAGIKRVVYSEKYRLEDGIELLKRAGIEVIYMSIES